MPHGPGWNRLNALGQVILAVAFALLGLRVAGWMWPGSPAERLFRVGFDGYAWFVDLFLAGILGYGLYFWFSGRTWCRFACPLAALMHVYARFSRFRILAEKKKCISCNVCTSVCHQGIDVMAFANKGLPMADPECVRCSACVEQCPTGVLSFGQVDPLTGRTILSDPAWLAASPVRRRELPVRPA
jgi:polyferredoxin